MLWNEPQTTNGEIRNYSVMCFHNESGVNIINETVSRIRAVTEFFLEPSSTYSCSVTAYNDYGPSPAQEAEGTTLPVTSENIECEINYCDHCHSCFYISCS